MRVDFNVESTRDSLRLTASLPTIKFLLQKKAQIVILSHRGRPQKSDIKKRGFGLKFAVPFLQKHLKQQVEFINNPFTIKKDSIKISKKNIFIVENLRFWKGEEAADIAFAKKLAKLGDFYVNDAFAVSHRKNTSVTKLPKLLPAYVGLLLEKEIKMLSGAMQHPKKPLVVIFGGAKVSDKLPAIKKLLAKASAVLLGSSSLKVKNKLPRSPKVYRPIDWISDKSGNILDIGPLTVELYKRYIKSAKTIIWNGPVGYFENKKFAQGSVAIAKAIANSRAFSLVGGGETTQLVTSLGLNKKISFLSTGGGAMLEFLAGKKLPGIEALKK